MKISVPFLLAAAAAIISIPMAAGAQANTTEQPDKYTWLEDIHGERSMDWVKQEDARTAAVFEKDPQFTALENTALTVLDSPDRLAMPQFHGGQIYNAWQDASHRRGIVRRTTLESYLTADPQWETVLDYDELSKADHQSWVGHGLNCLEPEGTLCLVQLSAGGEDAATLREMDLKTGKFIDGGFTLPRGKQRVAWLDKDTLLIGRDWGAGTMSEAGYPITVREWKRGEPLESAKEVYRGDVKDNGYGDDAVVLVDGQGNRVAFVERNLTTYTHETYLLLPEGTKRLAMPLKSDLVWLAQGELLIRLDEDWTPAGGTRKFEQGSLVAVGLEAAERDPEHLKPELVFAPTAQEFLAQMATTKNHVLLTTLEHVQGRAYIYTRTAAGRWTRKKLPVPDNQSVRIVATNQLDDKFFLTQTGFLTPNSAWLGDAQAGTLKEVKTEKPQFDASKDVVEQLEATSKDGTRVPYFVVHPKDMKYDGENPTLLTAYGGFEVSETPNYNAVVGKLWLEPGKVYVLANIRGGGEFGPAWHEAGLKTHRQRIYDDFYAVGEDLKARKITSTQKLGIMGGSNGGLLMGVEFTEHPEAWGAVAILVPLLDMLEYEHMSAGASWVGEYGSASVPEERAFWVEHSPYNALKPGVKYPVPLIFTTTKDDRVGPVHARKFAARMEEFGEPFYYDEVVEGGHGVGADSKQDSRFWAELYTYLNMRLGE